MATADTARLIASLELKDLFSPQAGKIIKSVDRLDQGISRTSGRAYKAGQQIGTGIKNGVTIAAGAIGFLSSQVVFGLKQLAELESVTAQTNAVLTSTKGAAGQSAEGIRNLAEEYEALNATMDDKVIQSGANVLLTFTNITNQAFKPALEAALNLSTAMGQDLQTSIVQVGKALNDPIKGITALRRIGVAFTADQEKQIKALVKTGDVLGAQKIILAELSKEFGGSFAAGGKTAAGAMAGLGDAVEDLQKALATGLFPVIQKVLPIIRKALADPAVLKGVQDLGNSIAGLFSDENLAQGADFLKGAFQTAKEAAPVLTAAAKAMFTVVQAAVALFKSLPPEIQKLAVGAFAINKLTGGLVTNIGGGIAGGIANFLAKKFTGGMNVSAGVVNVSGGVGGVAGGVGGASKTAGALNAVVKTFMVGAAIGAFAELKGVLDNQSKENAAAIAASIKAVQDSVSQKSGAELQAALAGIDAAVHDLENSWDAAGFAFRLNIDGVKDAVLAERATIQQRLDALNRDGGIRSERQLDALAAVSATDVRESQNIANKVEMLGSTVSNTFTALRDELEATHIAIASQTAQIVQFANGGGGAGPAAPAANQNIFVDEVRLDPSQVTDLRNTINQASKEAIAASNHAIAEMRIGASAVVAADRHETANIANATARTTGAIAGMREATVGAVGSAKAAITGGLSNVGSNLAARINAADAHETASIAAAASRTTGAVSIMRSSLRGGLDGVAANVRATTAAVQRKRLAVTVNNRISTNISLRDHSVNVTTAGKYGLNYS